MIGICFTGCNKTATIALLTFAITMQGALYSGFFTNPLDIAPNFSGTILGITNAIGAIPGWLAPLIAGGFTREKVWFFNVKGPYFNTYIKIANLIIRQFYFNHSIVLDCKLEKGVVCNHRCTLSRDYILLDFCIWRSAKMEQCP